MLFLKMFIEVKTEYFLVHGIHTATAYSKHPHIHTFIYKTAVR